MEIKNSADLKAAILELEKKELEQKNELLDNFKSFKESLSPVNLLKSTFNKVKDSPGITTSILKATIGMGVGMLSKRFLLGKSPGFLRKMVGSALQMGVTGLVAKKTDVIAETGGGFFKNLLGKLKSRKSR